MSNHSVFLLTMSAFTFIACNPFHREPAVEVSAKDMNLNARWHATLTSPANLAGAVQMKGTASMAPGAKSDNTDIVLVLSNATPGGVHPWQVHRGQCDADEGVFGPADAYQPVTVDRNGNASASATVPVKTPTTGNYFVVVRASAANPEMTVACGNLAPPTP